MSLSFESHLRASRVIAIFRSVPDEYAFDLAEALLAGGIDLIEVSLSDHAKLGQLAALARRLEDRAWIGAGTVTSANLAAHAQDAGARYLITPHVDEAVAAYASEHQLALILGALTPTEISRARALGSTLVKVFPASAMGPDYFRALRGPYPNASLIAVGGIDMGNIRPFLDAGAIGVALGSTLTGLDWSAPDFEAASQRAAELTSKARAQPHDDPRAL